MESKRKVAVIGAGPAGCMAAFFAQDNAEVTMFDYKAPLSTILCTGGGRCNLAYQEFDFKELAKFYPRGEKFLYSVFSAFSSTDTIEFFRKIGVETYVQDDLRIFPKSNCAKFVRDRILDVLKVNFIKGRVINVVKNGLGFLVETENSSFIFDKIIFAIGGHANFNLISGLGHSIIPPKPALCALNTKENLKPLQGLSLRNVRAEFFYADKKYPILIDDILFTHRGISGPLAYKISSYCAREDYNVENPIIISLKLLDHDIDLQEMFNNNPKKEIKNALGNLVTKSLVEFLLTNLDIQQNIPCCQIRASQRNDISNWLNDFVIHAISSEKNGEVVTSGGVNLDEVSSKTMESKIVPNLYFCGEVLDVDGLCGGFNLQNCWSTGYIAGKSI